MIAAFGCGNPIGPTQHSRSPSAPTHGSNSRYILISGVVTCVEDCDDDSSQPQSGIDGMRLGTDSVGIRFPTFFDP